MDAINYTTARATLAQTFDRVCQNHDPVIVTRTNAPSVVVLSLEDFESMAETAYLLRSPNNARRLLESIGQLSDGNSVARELLS